MPSAHGGAAGDAERKKKRKNKPTGICRGRKLSGTRVHLIDKWALFVRRLCLQGVVTVTTGVGIAVGTPVSTPSVWMGAPSDVPNIRRERRRAEWKGWHAVDHELEVNSVIGELQEIRVGKSLVEFADQVRRVFGANAE